MASSLATLESAVYGPQPHGPINDASNSPRDDNDPAPVALLVRELFVRAREARRQLIQQWKMNYRTLNNRDYRPGAAAWDEEPAISNVWPVVASATAWMTDQRPTFDLTPTAESFSPYWDFYDALARTMNTCLMSCFTSYMLDGEINKALWDTYTYGIGYFKTQWEAPLADGLGDAVFRRVDPFTLYPDPHASDESTLTHIIEAKQMSLADLDRAWPGAARLVATSHFLTDSDEAPHKLDSSVSSRDPRSPLLSGQIGPLNVGGVGATSPQSHVPSGMAKHEQVPMVTVLEAYIRGYKTIPTDDPNITKVVDNWRCIVVCGNVVIMDRPCGEVHAFNMHPYSRLVLFDTGEWYGPCVTEFLAPIQRIVNWLLGAIGRNIYLMGNPVLYEDMRSASRNKRFTNRPGQRVEGSRDSVGWMNPPQIHPQMSVDLVRYYEGKIETISGLSAMVRGFAPSGRNAQGVLDSVQDAAFVRVRASLRELERTLRSVCSRMAATIAEFYTEPRLMSIIGPDGRRTHTSLQARHFYAIDADNPDERIPLRFSLTADAGSQLPTSKQARAAEAKHLYQLGAIDDYELLKAIGWPSYANVAQRVMQLKAGQAQADAQKGK